jgi:superfamily II DNA or RNA helicase
MDSDLKLTKVNEAWVRVDGDMGIARELAEHLTFEVPGAKFSPKYKARVWDGKIRLLNSRNMQTYAGLVSEIQKFCEERDYSIDVDPELIETEEFSLAEAKDFADTLKLPFVPHDHQLRAFALAVRHSRGVLVSPTASGKSLIAYLITRYYLDQLEGRILIVVPTISLVHQLYSDFADYGFISDKFVHRIFGGQDKETDKSIVITTWQSVYELPKSYFDSFEVIIGDEAHLFKAQSLTKIMTNMTDTKYRFGMTGTLDGSQVNELVLTGLFGPTHKIIDTKELIDNGTLAPIQIKVLMLMHPIEECKKLIGGTYQDEVGHIISFPPRNKFIRNLVTSLKGNTLVLYAYVEKHGQIIYDLIKDKSGERKVFFVHGGVDGDERESIRHIVEQEKDAIIVASYGTFSTGINIKNLHNVVFASPTKSRIRTLQSIGRGLRTIEGKDGMTLFDIADNLSTSKDKKNYTLNHLIERVKMYNSEGFPYELHTIKIRSDNEPRRSILFEDE